MSAVDTSLFTPELVFFDFEAADREEFFAKLGDELKSRGYVKDTWYEAITTREKNYPTGLACEAVQVAVLQALMMVFMDDAAVADVLAQTTPEGMVETMVKYCGREQ